MNFSALFRILLIFLCCLGFSAQANPWKKPEAVKAELIAKYQYAVPGQPLQVGLLLKHDAGWHTYWKATGDTGLPTKISWNLPAGWQAGEVDWPVPEVFKLDQLINYGYKGETLLPIRISVPEDARLGETVALKASVSWLMCSDQCVPGNAELSLPIRVESAPGALNKNAALFETATAFIPAASEAATGTFDAQNRALSVTFKADRPFNHFYIFAEGEATIEYSAPQSADKKGSEITIRLQGSEELKAGDIFSGLFVADGGPKEGGWAQEFSATLKPGIVTVPSASADNSDSHFSAWLAAGMALLGGLILNVMPCVFPVLSLKILNLVEHRDGKLFLHGVVFTAGVLLTMFALAILLMLIKTAGFAVGWGFQLQSPIFVALLAFLFIAISLNLLGVFEFAGVRISGASFSDSLLNSFATGILAVVVASPCTAPFMGAALGYALTASHGEALLVFLCLGLGMSLPWLALSAFPALTAWLPRPGKWMNVFRSVMALPMALTALWLFWVLSQQVGSGALVTYAAGAVFLSVALWIYGKIQFGIRTPKALGFAASIACVAAFGLAASPFFASKVETAPNHNAWSVEAVESAIAEGHPVFVDFTASWCVTCQANKIAVLDRSEIQEAFKKHNVVFLVADWTNRNPEISKALEGFGRSGVPLYLLYNARGQVHILPELLTEDIILKALNQLNKP